jgi:uncharacterized protein (DUF1697 family)
MHTYIAILRGINVAGKMIKMEALRKALSELGLKNINTYIQSGNIVFQTGKTDFQKLEEKISAKIKEAFTYDVPVIVTDKKELKQLLENNPFLNHGRKEDESKLHVTFFSDVPDKSAADKVAEGDYGRGDELVFSGRAVYLFCPVDYGHTKLSNSFLEKKIKLTATTRNWKTVNELYRMAEEAEKMEK